MVSLLWLIAIILFVLWIVGFAVHWGTFIWFLLVAAAVVFLFNLLSAGRSGRWY